MSVTTDFMEQKIAYEGPNGKIYKWNAATRPDRIASRDCRRAKGLLY